MKKILYPELIRIVAIIAVIAQHVSAHVLKVTEYGSADWQVTQVMNILISWGVPVFVMVSGMFLLDPRKDITLKKIYRNYIPRMLIALTVMIPVQKILVGMLRDGWSMKGLFKDAIWSVISTNGNLVYWYLYMMIGVYIILPILRAVTRVLSKEELLYVIVILFISNSILPFSDTLTWEIAVLIRRFTNALMIKNLIPYALLLMIGYYLSRYELKKNQENLLIAVGIVGMIFTVYMCRKTTFYSGKLELLWASDFAPGMVMSAVAIFIFCKKISEIKYTRKLENKILSLGSLSFGVYLTHNIITNYLRYWGMDGRFLNVMAGIPIVTILIYVITAGLVYFLRKIKLIKYWM